MTTERKFKNLTDVLDKFADTKDGSCIRCQFCIRKVDRTITDIEEHEKELKVKDIPTNYCLMEKTPRLWLTDSELENEKYPHVCEIGNVSISTRESDAPLPWCFAFKQRTTTDFVTIFEDSLRLENFMIVFAEISRCQRAIVNVQNGYTQSRLDELIKVLETISD